MVLSFPPVCESSLVYACVLCGHQSTYRWPGSRSSVTLWLAATLLLEAQAPNLTDISRDNTNTRGRRTPSQNLCTAKSENLEYFKMLEFHCFFKLYFTTFCHRNVRIFRYISPTELFIFNHHFNCWKIFWKILLKNSWIWLCRIYYLVEPFLYLSEWNIHYATATINKPNIYNFMVHKFEWVLDFFLKFIEAQI